MIETRLALPVRSPTPFIVPWTWRAPASTAASVLATPHSASLWQWMATRTPVADGRDDRRAWPRRPAAAATSRWCRRGRRVSAPGAGGRAQAVQRVAGVVAVAVEEVLGVVDDALAAPRRRKATESAIIARFSSRVDAHDLLEVQAPRLADDRAHRREARRPACAGPRPRRPATPRRRVMPKAAISACSKRSCGQQLEELELLGVRGREAGLDEVDAELVELARDAHLLGRRQRQAGALHAVAQGGVVELDVGHGGPRAHCATPVQRDRHRVQPLAVALGAPVQGVLEGRLHRARDLAGLAAADRVVVDLAHGHELGGGAGHEHLVGQVELGAREVALDDLEAEVARDLHARLAVDAVEDPGGLRRREDRRRRGRRRCSRPSPRTRSRGRRGGWPPRSRPCGTRSWPGSSSGTGPRPWRAGSASRC